MASNRPAVRLLRALKFSNHPRPPQNYGTPTQQQPSQLKCEHRSLDDQSYSETSYDPATKPKPYSTFTFFPKLPIELRLMIWTYAMPANRDIIFVTKVQPHIDGILRWNLETFAQVPVFRACKESWGMVKRICEPLLNTEVQAVETSGPLMTLEGNTKMIYNPFNDTVVIVGHGLLLPQDTLIFLRQDTLQRLSLAVGGWIGQQPFKDLCLAVRDHCPRLKLLNFIVGFSPVPFKWEIQEQAQTLRMDSNLSDQVHFILQTFGKKKKKMLADFSANVEAVARNVRTNYDAFLESDGESWRNLDFKVSMAVIDLTQMNIIRWLGDNSEDGNPSKQVMTLPIGWSNGRGFNFHRYYGVPQLFGAPYGERFEANEH